jgi:hypothetical protein
MGFVAPLSSGDLADAGADHCTLRRNQWPPLGALQGGVDHRREELGGVVQTLSRETQIARPTHYLPAAIHHLLIAHWIDDGAFR